MTVEGDERLNTYGSGAYAYYLGHGMRVLARWFTMRALPRDCGDWVDFFPR
jgi:hypothetical protein